MNDTDEWQARMVLAHKDLEDELDALRKERARDTELILNARLDAVALRERIRALADELEHSTVNMNNELHAIRLRALLGDA